MKKFLKDKLQRKSDAPESPSRITNETVAEHREKILAGGRKFKYPVQYSRHKLVINSILVALGTLILLLTLGWYQLYMAQNTSKFVYRITQLIPVPVATVDGEWVRYSDYLKRYRSSIHFLQQNNSINIRTEQGKRQAEFYKRRELDSVVKDAFVKKIADQEGVTVTDDEVDSFIERELNNKKVSLGAYERTVLRSYYDWSLDEYKSIVKSELLKRKLSFEIDTAARDKAARVKQSLSGGADFAELAKAESDDAATKAAGGAFGAVPVNNQDPNGLTAAALKLEPNQTSDLIEGSDGYYIIKLIAKDKDNVQYAMIKVALTELDRRFQEIKDQDKVDEFITLEEQ